MNEKEINQEAAEIDHIVNQESEKEEASEKKERKKRKWAKLHLKYLFMSKYAILIIFVSIVLYMLISNWSRTTGFIKNLLGILSPFLIGILAAYFLSPLVDRIQSLLQKKVMKAEKYIKASKVVAMIITYVVVLGFITVAFVFVIPQMGQSIQELTQKIPGMYERVTVELTKIQQRFPELNTKETSDQIGKVVPNVIQYGTNVVSNIIPMVYSMSISIVKMAINILLGIFVSIYMIYSKEKFQYQAKRIVYAILPEKKGDSFCTTCRECNNIFGAFLISKAIDSLIIGCICCIAMSIIGLPYAVLLSVIVGITNMIPYFGPFIGAVPGVLIYLCTDWKSAIVFAIMILILQQFDGLILGPRLLGQSTGLSPIWVIFAITVGGAYFGVVGMFIGVPVVAVFAYLINQLLSSRLKDKNIKALEKYKEME